VVKPATVAFEAADAVAVRVQEQVQIDLIGSAVLPPRGNQGPGILSLNSLPAISAVVPNLKPDRRRARIRATFAKGT
jgi:hypothetical protein